MGQIILCETKEAEHSYTFRAFHREISTYEEMLYYIRKYFIFFVAEGIPDDLVRWVVTELGIRDLETDWKLLNNGKEKLKRLISCRNYFLPQEINVLMKQYDRYMEKNEDQRQCLLADEYLKQKRYEKALNLYQLSNISQKNAKVCYNIGICYAFEWDFELASEYFLRSYQLSGRKKAQNAYFTALMLQGEFSTVKIVAGPDYPAFMKQWEEKKNAFRLSVEEQKDEKNNQYKKNFLEQWKQTYRREADEWT